MKNTHKFHFAVLVCISLLSSLVNPNWMVAQPNLNIIPVVVNGCQVTITTTITPMVSGTESSVGLFYRLDGTNPLGGSLGSYFWPAIITAGTSLVPPTTTSKTLILPIGTYELECYEARKGGPIKTGHRQIIVPFSGLCSGLEVMPSSFPIPSSAKRIMLSPSWNAFTDPYHIFTTPPYDSHYVSNNTAVMTPSNNPWLFVTFSASQWTSMAANAFVDFDNSNFIYVGAIVDNYFDVQSNINWHYIQSIAVSSNIITITRKSTMPTNGEIHVHLIFKNKTPNTLVPETTKIFTATCDTLPGILTTTATVSVTGGPHDPNGLEVDKPKLCSCQMGEDLTYRVHFQNIGDKPATKVTVKLMDYANYLDASTISILQNQNGDLSNTFTKRALINRIGSDLFEITPISLPGTMQNVYPKVSASAASDFFEFRIHIKNDCLPSGIVIQPKAKIVFSDGGLDQPPIETNLEKTEIVDSINNKPCERPNNSSCPQCIKKKPCWLQKLFSKKK